MRRGGGTAANPVAPTVFGLIQRVVGAQKQGIAIVPRPKFGKPDADGMAPAGFERVDARCGADPFGDHAGLIGIGFRAEDQKFFAAPAPGQS